MAETNPSTPAMAAAATPSGYAGEVSVRPIGHKEESREEEKVLIAHRPSDVKAAGFASGSAARSHVALSLTTRQARLAEAWATAARSTVQFLIRRVAQGLAGIR